MNKKNLLQTPMSPSCGRPLFPNDVAIHALRILEKGSRSLKKIQGAYDELLAAYDEFPVDILLRISETAKLDIQKQAIVQSLIKRSKGTPEAFEAICTIFWNESSLEIDSFIILKIEALIHEKRLLRNIFTHSGRIIGFLNTEKILLALGLLDKFTSEKDSIFLFDDIARQYQGNELLSNRIFEYFKKHLERYNVRQLIKITREPLQEWSMEYRAAIYDILIERMNAESESNKHILTVPTAALMIESALSECYFKEQSSELTNQIARVLMARGTHTARKNPAESTSETEQAG